MLDAHGLCQYLFHDLPRYVGQPGIDSLKLHAQPQVIDPKQMKHRCMQIVNADWILNRSVAELICRAVRDAAFDPAAREHIRESFDVMISPVAAL